MILAAALRAVRCQLSAWHRDEGTVRTIDDFQVANNEAVVERNAAKRLKPVIGVAD